MPDREFTIPEYIRKEADAIGLDPAIALGVSEQESSFDIDAIGKQEVVTNGQRERGVGLFQFLPSTAKQRGFDPHDYKANVQHGVRYLKELLDNNEDPRKAIGAYGGVVKHTEYIDQVLQRIKRYQQEDKARAGAAAPAAPGTTPAPAAATTPAAGAGNAATPATADAPPELPQFSFDWSQPFSPASAAAIGQRVLGNRAVKAVAEGVDPRTYEGRQNIAGAVGGMGGSWAGGATGGAIAAMAGAPTGPGEVVAVPAGVATGSRIGSPIGAGLVAGGEHAIEEWLGTAPPAPPNTTAAGRAARAGGFQAGADVAAQTGFGLLRAGGKRLLQSTVGQYATEYFAKQQGEIMAALRAQVAKLQAISAESAVARNRVGRATTAAAGTSVDTARQAAAAAVTGAKDVTAKSVERARVLSGQGVDAATQAGADREAGFLTTHAMPPPQPESEAGRQVAAVFEGPADKARKAAGRAVDAAADNGLTVDIKALKAEAQRIADKELHPPERSFPRHAPEPEVTPEAAAAELDTGFTDAAGNPILRRPPTPPPVPPDTAAQVAGDITGAQYQELIKHPSMDVIGRILNAPDTVPFKDAHLWKSQLQQGLAGTYDDVLKSKATNITQHLAGELRRALSGHEPYDAATAAYEKLVPDFTQGFAAQVKKVALDAPEKIVQMIHPDDPTATSMLVRVLTEHAAEGGDAAAGREALGAVQRAWVERNLTRQGVEGLGERLAKLRQSPEFIEAFLNTPELRQTLSNLDAIHAAYQDVLGQTTRGVTEAKMKGELGVEAAKELGAQRTRETAQAGASAVRDVRATGKFDVEAVKRSTEDIRLEHQARVRDAQRAVSDAMAGTPAARAFEKSSLASDKLRKPEQIVGDAVQAALRGGYWSGLSAMRLLKGAKDRDLLSFVATSPLWTRAVIKTLYATSALKPGGTAIGSTLVKPAYEAIAHPPPRRKATTSPPAAAPATPQ